jgi:hypothetical protein
VNVRESLSDQLIEFIILGPPLARLYFLEPKAQDILVHAQVFK